ncbi:MAG: ABC transporter ATP-binding protein [Lachnospiraceae bacterium]|nr:ABC transporter ATP-binding protein [Lachnospiraceae bacterium]MBO4696579.1 ABC transporter ATP-binding protein [Lachnospiraceae bacterium]
MGKSIKYMLRAIDRKDRRRLFGQTLLGLLGPVIDVFSISMLLPILSDMADGQSGSDLLIKVIGIGLLLVLKTGFDLVLSSAENSFRYDAGHKLSRKMYELQLKEELSVHRKINYAQNLARVRRDVLSSVGILLSAKGLFLGFATMAGYAVVLMVSSGMAGVASIAAVLVLMVILYLINRIRVGSYSERVRELEIRTNETIYNTFGSYKEVKVSDGKQELIRRFDDVNGQLVREQKKFAMFSQIVSVITADILQAVVFFLLAILIALRVDISGHLSACVVFVTVLVKMLPLSGGILRNLVAIGFAEAGFLRFKESMEAYEEMLSRADGASVKHVPTFDKEIRVEGLTFCYEDSDTPIFSEADIIIPKGKTVAVTGSSGIGKTTFLDLLLGLFTPQAGKILYDGYDIAANGGNLGSIISYIPQEVYLGGFSIRDNVTFMTDPDIADEQRVIECLKCAHLYDDVCAMADGLDTLVGNNGVRLSGGQRQRLALARALYKDFELLVLDEATASLDMETEEAILESLRELRGGKTVLMVTHHASLAEACEIIYRLEDRKFTRVR